MYFETEISKAGEKMNEYTGNKLFNEGMEKFDKLQQDVNSFLDDSISKGEEQAIQQLQEIIDGLYDAIGLDESGIQGIRSFLNTANTYI